ncbi:MAG: serine protease Do [Planctomycetota bacterium]|jgi:serine protease Do
MGVAEAGIELSQQADGEGYEVRVTPVVEVVRNARPAVVFVHTDVAVRSRDVFGNLIEGTVPKTGSGFLIEADGYIVTNFHVVEGAQRIVVSFDAEDDQESYEAKLLSFSKEDDLALLKIDGRDDFPYLQPGTSTPLLGETVIAIGSPYGQTHTVSTGIISGLHRDVQAGQVRFTDLIQTDASINPGNSGGPLLNILGELIGINTAMNPDAENIGFAIPVSQLKRVLNDTLLSPDSARSWLGFELATLEDFVVGEVYEGGPAALAGLQVGDRITRLGGRLLGSEDDYRLSLITAQPGEPTALSVSREGKSVEVNLTPWGYFDGYLWARLGMGLQPTVMGSGYRRSTYLRVSSVQASGPAADLGLRPGDVVEAVQSASLSTPRKLSSREQLAWVLARTPVGSQLEVFIMQDRDEDGVFQLTGDNQERFKGQLLVR